MKEKLAEFINVIFGFRKFILMLMIFLVGVIFRLKNLVNGSEFVDLFKNTTIAFFGANGVEHIMTTVKEYIASKGAPAATSVIAGEDAIVPQDQIEPDTGDEAKAEAAASKS